MEHTSKQHFILSCGSTVDVPYAYLASRQISVIFYTYMVDETEFVDDMGRDPEALPRFYGFLKDGKLPSTSQINTYQYYDYFKALLAGGDDVLHIAFGSGMSGSVNNAMQAANMLAEEFPNQKLLVIDSLCSSSGYGLLVDGVMPVNLSKRWLNGFSLTASLFTISSFRLI